MLEITFVDESIFAEDFAADFAGEGEFVGLFELVVAHVVVAVGALEPLLAAGRPDGHLHVQNVLAHKSAQLVSIIA